MPTVAIVGRPNVGKSTLFNRLVGSRRAIVGDEPGITRDRLYGDAEWRGRHLRIVDTGGILPEDKDFIPAEIFRQAKVALVEADALWRGEPVRHLREVRSALLAKVLLRQRAGEPLAPLVTEQRAVFAPLFERLAEQFGAGESAAVIAAWRYESSQAVARLLDHLETLDKA